MGLSWNEELDWVLVIIGICYAVAAVRSFVCHKYTSCLTNSLYSIAALTTAYLTEESRPAGSK